MKKNIILFLFTLSFTLIVAEVALRIVLPAHPQKIQSDHTGNWVVTPERVWTEYHPELGWVQQANRTAVMKTPYFEIPIKTNSEGFRGSREYQNDKPTGKKRILFLGDSFLFGFGVGDNESFPSLLEKNDSEFEALNSGIPGYGLDQMYLLYQTLKKSYVADYVYICLYPEQFWRSTRAFDDTGHAKPYFKLIGQNLELQNTPVPKPGEFGRSQFPAVIERGEIDQFLRKSVLYQLIQKQLIRLGKNTTLIDPELSDEWVLGRQILKALVTEIKSSGATPVIMIVPPDRWMKGDGETSLRKSIVRFSNREKIQLLDLTPVLQKAVQNAQLTDYYIEHDWHWTPRGHQLAAQAISESLQV